MTFKTPDRSPGPADEEELALEDRTADGDPTSEGAIRRLGSVLRYYVGGAVTQIARWKNPPVGFDGVDMGTISDGQGLAYNDTSKQFEPVTLSVTLSDRSWRRHFLVMGG